MGTAQEPKLNKNRSLPQGASSVVLLLMEKEQPIASPCTGMRSKQSLNQWAQKNTLKPLLLDCKLFYQSGWLWKSTLKVRVFLVPCRITDNYGWRGKKSFVILSECPAEDPSMEETGLGHTF